MLFSTLNSWIFQVRKVFEDSIVKVRTHNLSMLRSPEILAKLQPFIVPHLCRQF
ncbi:hypothetical protein GXM_04960 [Nostoc sphaeroides CCNUC1]|uniref:Uncharacterized protein n=1 Tax=Nostoc sphaeroides CCNUC1 TaxID=2653204 RepID=A0A5P8W401_9NOSO|nr:hypothetical protein GXM_04960 [Nostoc sphaeroides CCNUC1]